MITTGVQSVHFIKQPIALTLRDKTMIRNNQELGSSVIEYSKRVHGFVRFFLLPISTVLAYRYMRLNRYTLTPKQPTGWHSLDLPTPEGWKAELTWWQVTYRDGVDRQSPIQVLTGPGVE